MSTRSYAGRTAFGPMAIPAVEQDLPPHERLVDDPLAGRFTPRSLRPVVAACRWAPVRRLLIRLVDRNAPGIWGGIACRKHYLDDRVREGIDAGAEQLVILGAGFDTRAFRLAVPAGIAAFEVDLPANSVVKQEIVEKIYGRDHGVEMVPVDFEVDDLADSLTARGFSFERTAIFVWEGVTPYLTEEAVRRTFRFFAKAASRSTLLFSYIRKDFVEGEKMYGLEKVYREFVLRRRAWHFSLAPDEVGSFLAEYGWVEREQVGAEEFLRWYVEPAGRDLPVMEIERFVHAVRQPSRDPRAEDR